jgi:hypothetical protein
MFRKSIVFVEFQMVELEKSIVSESIGAETAGIWIVI